METIVCQATEINATEIGTEVQGAVETIATLSSVEMSFVGGGCLAVAFA
jgi:hypothetical protein